MKFFNVFFVSVAFIALASCDKIKQTERVLDAAESIPEKMDGLSGKTDELKRLTIVAEMKKELEDTQRYRILSPVPYDLMAPAKKLGENFTSDEVVQYAYTMLSKINNARYDDNFGKPIDANNPEAVQFEKDKLGLFVALSAVAAFMSEATTEQLVTKVFNSEEYTTTALNLLAMRAYFIQNVLMKEKYSASKLTEIGSVEQAIKYNQALEKLIRLPFANMIRTEITGFNLMQDLNAALTYGLHFDACDMEKAPVSCLLNKSKALENWKSIDLGMTQFLKVNQFANSPELQATQNQRILTAQQIVLNGLKSSTKTQSTFGDLH